MFGLIFGHKVSPIVTEYTSAHTEDGTLHSHQTYGGYYCKRCGDAVTFFPENLDIDEGDDDEGEDEIEPSPDNPLYNRLTNPAGELN